MAVELRQFTITLPIGTTAADPVTYPMRFPAREIDQITVLVPPGPSGVVGFQLAMGTQQVLPLQAGQFIITDNEIVPLPIDNLPNSGDWSLIAYNSGQYPHSLQVRFYVDTVPQPGASPGPSITLVNQTPNVAPMDLS